MQEEDFQEEVSKILEVIANSLEQLSEFDALAAQKLAYLENLLHDHLNIVGDKPHGEQRD